MGREQFFFIAPFPAARGKEFLTRPLLARHFCALDGHLLSLHSSSADKTSRWIGIDIDRHDGDEMSTPEGNLSAALAWHDKLVTAGFDPLLMDSNGNGGYHLLIVFAEPVPTADIYGFGQDLINDFEKRGLHRRPETYPKHVNMEEGHFGNCLRLFGRHHTREHFSRVWSGDPGQDQWLEGAGAIDRILEMRLASPALLPKSTRTVEELMKIPSKPMRAQRPRVCVDLDGVLAQYDGWRGLDFTGPPIPGAVEFTRKLSEFAEVVIFTTRCAVEHNREDLREPTRPASDLAPRLMHNVRYWLEKHDFSFTEIYAGQGKPVASAYVDDRAVFCGPQKDSAAFSNALAKVKQLCSRSRRDAPAPMEGDARLNLLIESWPDLPEKVRDEIAAKVSKPPPRKKANKK
jgi:hypothetical protein